jgi:hypothetical protein
MLLPGRGVWHPQCAKGEGGHVPGCAGLGDPAQGI